MKQFDVIVVGGGHAGTEAALASARIGAKTVLVTLTFETIGALSCNPAIGGLGKGHLVREIDALDGAMARVADVAGIQFRLLNRRKGPAVQGPRAQVDRALYRAAMQHQIRAQSGLTVIEGEVVDLVVRGGAVSGVLLADETELSARAVVLTAGTFLRGTIHVGDKRQPGGRMGEKPSVRLAKRLAELSLSQGRLKTGTPPRLDGRTIRWDLLEEQRGDDEPVMFSFLNDHTVAPQVSCRITHTNERTHEIVRKNLHRSAMYGGQIEGVGPRYCPSLEDKVVRFADKSAHQVFLEPEGLTDTTVYPNGISSSLPVEVQTEYVRSIKGLEQVRILQPGYAIEYDFFDPRQLRQTLELRVLGGLFLAGQINGTTGYEEAGAQGMVAGLNAALAALDRSPVLFTRSNSYIGVMVDDLITRGVTEPYRMFTSRAEFRLTLRADNADQRLTPMGVELGAVGQDRARRFEEKRSALKSLREALQSAIIPPHVLDGLALPQRRDGAVRSAYEILGLNDVELTAIEPLLPEFATAPAGLRAQLKIEAVYAPYEKRQAAESEALRRDEAVSIPEDFSYRSLSGLSTELTLKLERAKPADLGQAARLEGMTPAALTLLLARLRRQERTRVGQPC